MMTVSALITVSALLAVFLIGLALVLWQNREQKGQGCCVAPEGSGASEELFEAQMGRRRERTRGASVRADQRAEPGRHAALISGTIPGAEAKSRRPRFKEYKRARDAEAFASGLGVGEVAYAGRIDIANACNSGLFIVFERGVPLPSRLVVEDRFARQENEDPNEMAYYLAGLGNQPGEIYINGEHPAWRNLEAAMRRARENHDFSTGDFRHAIVHEMGELAMHLSVGAERFDPLHEAYLADETVFRRMGQTGELDEITDAVSDRATENHSELVAEVFAALMLGRTELLENEIVSKAYTRFGGEQIRQYDPKL